MVEAGWEKREKCNGKATIEFGNESSMDAIITSIVIF